MSGLNDGRALKTLIPQLHARRLVLVDGDTATNEDMRSVMGEAEVYTPGWMEAVQIGQVTSAYTVQLGRGCWQDWS